MSAGHPNKLTPEVQQKVCDAVRVGNGLDTAAALAGVSKSTLRAWLQRGAAEAAGDLHSFAVAVQEAKLAAKSQVRAPVSLPPKLTPEVQQKICDALRAGNFLATAAAFAGVGKTAVHEWLKRVAQEDQGICHDFAVAVEKAQADAEARAVMLVTKAAGAGILQAATWFLERKFPEHWGRRDRLDATIKGAISHFNISRVDLSALTDEELDAFEKLNAKVVAASDGAGDGRQLGQGGEGAA